MIWRGLFWREWLQHGSTVCGFLALWLLGLWAFPLFFHPGFLLAFGVLYAIRLGPAFGGADAAEGSEEFAFALPPTRAQRYLARLALGGGILVVLLAVGLLAISCDLPQALWGLVFSSGFTEPFPRCEPRFLYAMSFAVPFAVFSFTYNLASRACSPQAVTLSWFYGTLSGGAVLGGGFLLEHLFFHELNGYLSGPALLVLGSAALVHAYTSYSRKEGVSRPESPVPRSSLWVWLLIGLAVFLILAVLWSGGKRVPYAPPPARAEPPTQKED